jgi:hypothetical protein
MDSLSKFQQFFDACVGNWTSDRTYHYLSDQKIERSNTKFLIKPLTDDRKSKVLTDNNYPLLPNLEKLPGYNLAFETISETGEKVSQELNLMFVPQKLELPIVEGDYLRDRAYEEAKPMTSSFVFNTENQELLMTTNYTYVVSVDSITLNNPNLRIRKIINYAKSPQGEQLNQITLVGFGVEQKT